MLLDHDLGVNSIMSRDLPPDSPLLVLPGDRGPRQSQGRYVLRHPWSLPGGDGRTWWQKLYGQ